MRGGIQALAILHLKGKISDAQVAELKPAIGISDQRWDRIAEAAAEELAAQAKARAQGEAAAATDAASNAVGSRPSAISQADSRQLKITPPPVT
ncbi:MAG TPA: hypothetical protein VES36_01845 [Candidatus Limnocylindrales bacterium]|nr:hypothetical protein [Candidatus Limnocylindrales bacterium]